MPEEILETPQPPQPTEQKATNWPKIILAAVLGLGLLAGSAYAGYYYGIQQVQPAEEATPVVSQPTPTPTPTPVVEDLTKDWRTYTNTKYGYSIKCPSDWFISSTDEMERSILLSPINMYKAGYISLFVSPNASRGITRCEQDRSNCNFVIDNKIFGERTESTTKDVIFLPGILGDYDMEVILYKYEGEKDNSLTLNLMLSTFKFID